MLEFNILDELEKLSSNNSKIEFLKQYNKNEKIAKILDYALNFKHKFFVNKWNMFGAFNASLYTEEYHFKYFFILLDNLKTRNISGNEALAQVENFFITCSEQERKWYSRILTKDLKLNMGISLVNKAGFNIPDFSVMLAKDGKECKSLETIVAEGVYLSPKFDGYRCLAICDHGNITLYSRNGSEYENFPSITETLSKMCKNSRFVLDGEIMSDDFNKMQQSAFASTRGTTVGDVKYHVFGFIPHEEWTTGKFVSVTKNRLDNLKLLFDNHKDILDNSSNVVPVTQKLVYQVSDILEYEQECLKNGYEGAMALPNIPYYLGKKTNKLMKFKSMLSQDCRVVGIYEGQGQLKGTMGGLNLIQENNVACDVGSGFSHEDRDYIWNNSSDVMGRICEIQYQELSEDGVCRFPVFLRWRSDK